MEIPSYKNIDKEKIKVYVNNPLDFYVIYTITELLFKIRLKIIVDLNEPPNIKVAILKKIDSIRQSFFPQNLTLDELDELISISNDYVDDLRMEYRKLVDELNKQLKEKKDKDQKEFEEERSAYIKMMEEQEELELNKWLNDKQRKTG